MKLHVGDTILVWSLPASEDIEVTRSASRGLLFVISSWILILIHSVFSDFALKGLVGDNIDFALWFYVPLIGFLGGSAVIAMALGKRKFLTQLALTVIFSTSLAVVKLIVDNLVITNTGFLLLTDGLVDLFNRTPVTGFEYLLLPFLVIILFDLYANTGFYGMSRRRWVVLVCTIVAILLLLAFLSYNGIIPL